MFISRQVFCAFHQSEAAHNSRSSSNSHSPPSLTCRSHFETQACSLALANSPFTFTRIAAIEILSKEVRNVLVNGLFFNSCPARDALQYNKKALSQGRDRKYISAVKLSHPRERPLAMNL